MSLSYLAGIATAGQWCTYVFWQTWTWFTGSNVFPGSERNNVILIVSFVISGPMAYVEREEYANLYISCKVGIIQTVNATLVRLPNAEKCKGASFNDGTSICKSESQMITQKLQKICTGRRDCTYVLEYRISCDSLEPDRSPLLLRVRYECDTGTYRYQTNGRMIQQISLVISLNKLEMSQSQFHGPNSYWNRFFIWGI